MLREFFFKFAFQMLLYYQINEWNERTVKQRACLVNREKMVQQDFVKISSWAICSVYPNTNVLWKLFQEFVTDVS